MKLTPLVQTLAVAFGGLAMLATPAIAQQDPQKLERVEITGSSIKRAQDESPTAVQIITRKDIEKTGATSTNELFLAIPAFSSFNDESNATGAPSRSTVGFRQFAADSVLILVNGRRISRNAVNGSAYDLNSIPLAVVERVEVLKDGGSAIYGSDAIAGVVNIITKKDFTGVDAGIYYGRSNYKDATERRVTATVGFGNFDKDRFNAFVSIDKFTRDIILRKNRPETFRDAPGQYNNATPTGNFTVTSPETSPLADGAFYPVNPCRNPLKTDVLGTYCPYFFNESINLIPKTERLSAMVSAQFKASESSRIYFEALSSRNESLNSFSPPPGTIRELRVTAADNLIGRGGARVPTDSLVSLRIRFDQAGVRRFETDAEFSRYTIGTDGTAFGWDYVAEFGQSKTQNSEFKKGFFNYRLYTGDANPATGVRTINPFIVPTAAQLTKYQIAGRVDSLGSVDFINLRLNKELFTLPAGPVGASFGFSSVKESLNFLPDANSQSGAVSVTGTPDLPVGGSRRVNSIFAELAVPIIKNLEAQFAVRYDKYGSLVDTTDALTTGGPSVNIGSIGSVTTPKIALRFAPTKQLTLRGSYSKGFVAPDFEDLFRDNVESAEFIRDNPRCKALGLTVCETTQYDSLNRSSATLKPARSTSFALGAAFSPTNNFTATLDYFNINKTDVVARSLQFLVDNPNYVLPNGRLASSYVERAGGSATGAIVALDNPIANLAGKKAAGLELGLQFKYDLGSAGKISIGNDYYYVLKDVKQDAPGEAFKNSIGVIDVPKYRNKFTVGWDIANYGVLASVNTLGSFFDVADENALADPTIDKARVPTFTTLDLQASVSDLFLKGLRGSIGVKNLANRRPTLTIEDQNAGFPSSQSALGRFAYIQINYSFR